MVQTSRRTLTGTEKAAAILLAVGREQAGRLLQHLDSAEMREVARASANLGAVSAAELEALVREFLDSFRTGSGVITSSEGFERLLTESVSGDVVRDVMAEVRGQSKQSVWDRVSMASEQMLASYVSKEHPQTAAVILARIRPATAAKVLGLLSAEQRNLLMRRILSLKPIVEKPLREVERTMHDEFTASFSRTQGSDTHARMADILNKMEREQLDDALNALMAHRPKSAEMLKSLLFTFEDIVRLNPRTRVAIFDKVETDTVVMALRGTPEDFREAILSTLTLRARRFVEHELSTPRSVTQREVLEARRSITDHALDMANRGEIELNPSSEDEEVLQ